MGVIEYGKGEENTGLLLYMKPSLVGGEIEYIHRYAKGSDTFPQETTADQFFDEAQFEAYRALGRHIATLAVNSPKEDAVEPLEDAPREPIDNGSAWFDRLKEDTSASSGRPSE